MNIQRNIWVLKSRFQIIYQHCFLSKYQMNNNEKMIVELLTCGENKFSNIHGSGSETHTFKFTFSAWSVYFQVNVGQRIKYWN